MSQGHSPEFIAEMKTKLLETKQRLQEDLGQLKPHTEIGDDLDEAASEVSVDEVNQDLIARLNSDLEKVDTALGKIEAGTYGIAESGELISEDRLRAIPWADKGL